jgi:enamine deaminase RidA (YjgF/YER057c/UK114 family)
MGVTVKSPCRRNERILLDRRPGGGRCRGDIVGIGDIAAQTEQVLRNLRTALAAAGAATEFFVELGLVLQGEWSVEGRWVDRVVGLEGVQVDAAMMQTPDGHGRLELVKFHSPSHQGDNRHAPANTPGIRHIAFAVEDIDAVVAGLRARGAELVASWSATRTATGSATSAARRGSSSSWQSRSADGAVASTV